jgi:glycosyltransferase involved in cell wall biosynthesis
MRFGLMLRAYDEHGGIGVYTRNMVDELLRLDQHNEYVLFFRNPDHLSRFAHHERVTAHYLPAHNKLVWDQVAVPLACRKHQVDVVFHPKFTAPLLAPCRVVMAVHGADWFIPEQAQFYHPLDVQYIRAVMPLYFRKCHTVISVSQLTTENFNRVLYLPAGKVRTIYFGPARHFRPVKDAAELAQVRAKYALPERFIFTLTKRSGGDRRKNLGQIFRAYARYHQQVAQPCKLVVGGKDCHLFKDEYGVPDSGWGRDVVFPGWLDQQDLPAIYSLATLYFYPSRLEAFPIPLTEAMTCGTPIVTSNHNGLKEIAGDAALFVDPDDTEALAQALCRVTTDEALQAQLTASGLGRAKLFSWEKCARETIAVLENAARS